ncbi:MAG: molybdopterin-dependent oxidoreductase [Leptospiraceae bacterium]|nr:molybdopterin-dependent oxidoreductase [Leptospiraceae bacterium]
MEVIYRACNLCEAICGLSFEMKEGKIETIRADKDDPLSEGHICPKGPEMKTIYEDPDRLRKPMKRFGTEWKEISYEEAFEEITAKIVETQKKFGNDSVGAYLGNPNTHNYGNTLFGYRFFKKLNSINLFSATSVDQLPHHFAAHFMFGHQFLLPIPDIDRTQYFLVMGANPIASKGSLMTAPNIDKRLKVLRARKGKLVVLDPRRTETAEKADEHHFIRPETDVFFLLAFIHVMFQENRLKLERLGEFTEGIDELKTITEKYSPERVEKITGISHNVIRKIVKDFTESESAVIYGRVGLSMQSFGAVCQWLINCINIITGNLDRVGGAMFPSPAIDLVSGSLESEDIGFDRWRSNARNLPEFYGELPVSALSDEILSQNDNRIKFLFTCAGNPVLSTPNGNKMERALESLDYMVSIDLYINETTRHANIILPPSSPLEHEHYDIVFHMLAVRNTAKFSRAIFPKADTLKHDWEIFGELMRRLEGKRQGKEPKPMSSRITPETTLDFLLRTGTYGKSHGLNLAKLKENPHGIDFGYHKEVLPEKLKSKDKKIRLVPEIFQKDIPRLEERERTFNGNKFLLIGRRHLKSNNSWMHNSKKLMSGKNRCTIWIHPMDAEKLGVKDLDNIRVRSSVNQIVAPVEITEGIMQGVLSLPYGFGHHRKGIKLNVASESPGVSINDLTDDTRIDELCGNAAFSGLEVEIERE